MDLRERLEAAVVRTSGRLSPRLQHLLAGGGAHVVDGQHLEPEMRLLLKLIEKGGGLAFQEMELADARAELTKTADLLGGPSLPMDSVRNLAIPGPGGALGTRLYTPAGDPDTLLVFLHGGGWTLGDLDSHDKACRFLATHAATKVLAVDYRLAPEHPFPAAPLDAFAAFTWAHRNAAELGVDSGAIAVGGDSAGGNLAVGVCLQARDSGGPVPAFQLLMFPSTDLLTKHRSHALFSDGYLLDQATLDWYFANYLPTPEAALDPLASPMLAQDLSGLPPAYVATAGFDPIRDDGESFAAKLRTVGVPVALRRHAGLLHGFLVSIGYGPTSVAAMHEAAGALRTGLALGRVAQPAVL